MPDTVLNGNYTIGDAKWDTGKCYQCGKELTLEDRKQACINMLVIGFMYWCRPCADIFFEKNKGMFR
jgi:hypothetical protein